MHIAARILGQAAAGEILVSSAVRDLVAGSGTGFEDRGSVELRGVPGTWQLLAIDRHGARAESAEARLASTPTPGPRTAMRRSNRAVEVTASRTPWILRGMSRPRPGRRSRIRRLVGSPGNRSRCPLPEAPRVVAVNTFRVSAGHFACRF